MRCAIGSHHASEGSTAGSANTFETLSSRRLDGRALFNPNITLSKKEGVAFLTTASEPPFSINHQINILMDITLRRDIPTVTKDGQDLNIPASAWDKVRKIARREFSASLQFTRRPAGLQKDGRVVPFPHVAAEAIVNSCLVTELVDQIDPLIDDVIKRHLPQLATAKR